MLPKSDTTWTLFEAAHLLNRAGFGGGPSEVEKLHAKGREKAVDFLVSPGEPPDAFPAPAWSEREQVLADMRERFQERRTMMQANNGLSAEAADKARREAQQAFQRDSRQKALTAQGWWFNRMLKSKAPLREKMTLFWHDHFATSVQKVKQPALLVHQNELFRSSAFGSFRDLTQAILLDPAMMLYLDTQTSKKGKPNENFAREVMELFTLGEGNYTEEDVRETARAFTGYELNRRSGKVEHNKRQWDSGSKTIFGKTGPFDGEAVIDLIFQKREPARFISKKLWEFFVSDTLSPETLESLTDSLMQADFQTGPLLREIFLSKEFYSDSSLNSQIKCPVQYIISLIKQLEIDSPPLGFPITAEQQLGQILFMPPNVAGWDWGQAWINTNTLLTRYNLAGFLTKGTGIETGGMGGMGGERMKTQGMASAPMRMGRNWKGPDYEKIAPRPLRDDPTVLVDALIYRFFQSPVPDKARASFIDYAIAKKGAILTNKETAELCHLMLSTPYYQLC